MPKSCLASVRGPRSSGLSAQSEAKSPDGHHPGQDGFTDTDFDVHSCFAASYVKSHANVDLSSAPKPFCESTEPAAVYSTSLTFAADSSENFTLAGAFSRFLTNASHIDFASSDRSDGVELESDPPRKTNAAIPPTQATATKATRIPAPIFTPLDGSGFTGCRSGCCWE